MLEGSNHIYGSDLARRSQSWLLNEAYFNQRKVQLNKSNDIFYVDKSLLPNNAGNTSVRNPTQSKITFFNKSINESYNDAALTVVYQTPRPPQYIAVVEANQPECFLEGMDQVVFEITSDKVASKVNEIKNNYPHGFIYPDARLNEPISLTFPVYTNFLGYDELTHLDDVDIRLLFDYPSELVNIKEKVLRQLGLGIAPPIPQSSQDLIDKKVQEWEIFWEGTDKNSTIKLISLKHYPVPSNFTGCSGIPIKRDVNYSGNVSSRLIFDFTINTSDLADMISSPELRNRISSPKMESLPNIPTHSELELRIPDALRLCDSDSVPSRFLDLEYRLLMALGIPKSDLPSIDPGSFSITAMDFII